MPNSARSSAASRASCRERIRAGPAASSPFATGNTARSARRSTVLFCGVLVLLLIASCNIASLTLAHVTSRGGELALRRAIGRDAMVGRAAGAARDRDRQRDRDAARDRGRRLAAAGAAGDRAVDARRCSAR